MLLGEFTRALDSLLLAGSFVALEPSTLEVVGSFVALEPLSTLELVGSFVALEPLASVLEMLLLGFVFNVLPSLTILDGLSVALLSTVLSLDDEPEATLPAAFAEEGALLTDEPPLSPLPLVIMRPLPTPLPYPLIVPWCP